MFFKIRNHSFINIIHWLILTQLHLRKQYLTAYIIHEWTQEICRTMVKYVINHLWPKWSKIIFPTFSLCERDASVA